MTKVELICDECGKKFERSAGEVNRNARIGRRMFCSRICNGKGNFKNIPESSKTWEHLRGCSGNTRDSMSPYRYIYKSSKNKAKIGNLQFLITLEDMDALWKKQNGICPYTGVVMNLPSSSWEAQNAIKSPFNVSLDRIDSSHGYSVDNIQFVSMSANFAKNDFTHEQMLDFCRAIATHHKQSACPC